MIYTSTVWLMFAENKVCFFKKKKTLNQKKTLQLRSKQDKFKSTLIKNTSHTLVQTFTWFWVFLYSAPLPIGYLIYLQYQYQHSTFCSYKSLFFLFHKISQASLLNMKSKYNVKWATILFKSGNIVNKTKNHQHQIVVDTQKVLQSHTSA